MTILYEVNTSHTKKVLKAFAKLYTEVKGAKKTFRFIILAVIFLTMPRALHAPRAGYIVCWSFAVFVVLLAVARQHITYLCLLMQDTYYKEETPITMYFGHSKFEVVDKSKNSYKYAMIQKLYADHDNMYFHMEEGDLFIIPKSDFVVGTYEEFYEFMQRTTGKVFEEVNLDFKQKLTRMRFKMRQAEEEHDEKVEKRKNKK